MPAQRGSPSGASWKQYADREFDGETLRIWERPTDDPHAPRIALVHGFEESRQSWEPLTAHLSPDLRLYALDLPWRNGSQHRWASGGTSPAWLERALSLLPGRPDLIVAHSYGATTLLDLLTRRVEAARVPSVLVAPVFRPDDRPMDPGFFDEAVQRFRGVLADGLRAQMGPRAQTVPVDILASMADKVRERVEPHGFLQFYATLARCPDLRLEDVDVPVLMISGTRDPSAPPQAVDALRSRIPHFSLHQDPGFSHFCQLQQPGPVAEAITAQLTRLGLRPIEEEANHA
ncbi:MULTISPECIES: alpha/beta fold hydrolase [Streptomyces]|uniref:alpha/beta fold hydrolase n=1 Tax=Streptomyces TaxID=1883 RepID=UPI0004BEA5C2|nr:MULTISPECIES: alpha/beta hydrolase [Streptomyces]KJY48069.1 hypothetical protein VR46_00040 [Streptomyces sp. NRRL S-444]WSN54228.1 alpha/beta hydrolase [Streptomyces sp. NBC_01296]